MRTKDNGLDRILSSGKLYRRVSDTNLERSMVSSDFEEMKKKVSNFQQEIYKLQAANSDLTQVNKRWHRYNTDMQIFIDKLQTTIRDQQEQINNIGENNLFSSKHQNGKECTRSECRRLREEIIKLKEDNNHLIHQIKAHKDDWEAEKNEKQQIIKERDCLQLRLEEVLVKNNEACETPSRSCECCNSWTKGNDHVHGTPYAHDSNIVCDGCCNAGDVSSAEDELRASSEEGACCSRSATESFMSLPPFGISPTSSANSLHSDHQTIAMGIKSRGATVTSYVQMPVVKSSSAPDRRSTQNPTKFVNSISLSVLGPNPLSLQSSRTAPLSLNQKRGVDSTSSPRQCSESASQSFSPLPFDPSVPSTSSTDSNVITCPNCHRTFPPKSYVEYMDHCETCHSKS